MSSARITIVTPSFNQGRYLERNLRSVIEQDYPEIEHWVLDGGSQDETTDILARYAAEYPHLHWLSEKDRGQSDAVNKGFHRATGDIIGWINSDDTLAPGALKTVAAFFAAHPAAKCLVGDTQLIDENDQPLPGILYGRHTTHEEMQREVSSVVQQSVFLKREVVEWAGDLDVRIHYAMDHEYFLRVTRYAPLEYVPGVLANFRFQPDSKTMNAGPYHASFDNLKSNHRYGAPLFSAVNRSSLYIIATEPLRRIAWLRSRVRQTKALLGLMPKGSPHV